MCPDWHDGRSVRQLGLRKCGHNAKRGRCSVGLLVSRKQGPTKHIDDARDDDWVVVVATRIASRANGVRRTDCKERRTEPLSGRVLRIGPRNAGRIGKGINALREVGV